MIENLNARMAIIGVVLISAILCLVPNFYDVSKGWWFSQKKLTLGLDIQGGLHLVMGVDNDGVIREKIRRMSETLKSDLTKEEVKISSVAVTGEKKEEIEITTADASQVEKVKAYLARFHNADLQVLSTTGQVVLVRPFDVVLNQYKKEVIDQAIEVIRNRIDEFGVAEPVIAAQGGNRIMVQLPGIKNADNAKSLINRTARLKFMIVYEDMAEADIQKLISEAETAGNYKFGKDGLKYGEYVNRLNEDLKEKLPKNTEIAFEKLESAASLEFGRRPFLLKTDQVFGGENLDSAMVGQGEMGQPVVNFRIAVGGRAQFGELTGANRQKRMAIVLDNVIQSAPTIQSRLTEGGQITLGGRNYEETYEEARLISVALRAGALPVALQQLEERTVGPSLGADSVKKGEFASLVSAALIFVFMIVLYKGFGVVASLSLMLNVLLTFALLTTIGTTLTLPGIAGMALTVGMAVDANIIIFERIKEELKKGGSLASALQEGFSRAFSAIFDSNVTTVATCLVLMYFGSGPIRGFAVTLTLGLTTSMFSAVFFSRAILEFLIVRMKFKNLAI